MKTVALSGNNRAERGSSNAKTLRKDESIPCVIYGGKENTHFTVNEVKFGKLVNTPEVFFIDLDVDGKKFKAIIKDVQYHPVTDRPLHVDFLEVSEDKALTVKLPVSLKGNSRGVMNGGKLRTVTRKLTVSGLPSALPENIELDITNLRIGQSIKVGEIEKEGLRFLDADNAVVVAIKRSRVAVADNDDEEDEEGAEAAAEGAEAPAAEGGEEAKAEEPAAAE
ncbi:MAG: 50S ribosomal protein L25/general stress protein Ctc [Flavobacteriales bacterium]|nr:50S ribosomal protein L25/general stress protein Ctc [Flavobacteriales bacterium]